MNDQTTLADAVARAFRDHGITAALTALIGGTMALIAAITRKAFTNEALLEGASMRDVLRSIAMREEFKTRKIEE